MNIIRNPNCFTSILVRMSSVLIVGRISKIHIGERDHFQLDSYLYCSLFSGILLVSRSICASLSTEGLLQPGSCLNGFTTVLQQFGIL